MDLYGITKQELENLLANCGEKTFRAAQIFQWIYKRGIDDWNLMSNIPKGMRLTLDDNIRRKTIEHIKTIESKDCETTKFLCKLNDNMMIESVLIRSGTRRTVCVSTQVGCPARCAFCASGRKGLIRNLLPAEIVEQVVTIDKILAAQEERVSHVVFMGMGEPLENYYAVVKAITILISSDAMNISRRRITLSTVGVIEKIRALATEGLNINLVLSLHAPNQSLREKIIPYAKKNHLKDLLRALDDYSYATKRDITYEYTIMHDVNDTPNHAYELAALLKNRQCSINLIPYNNVEGLPFYRPPTKTIKTFHNILSEKGIITTCRYTKGDDIAAACGQLAIND